MLAAVLAAAVSASWTKAQLFSSCLGFPGKGLLSSTPAPPPRVRDIAGLDSAEGGQDDLEEWMLEGELQKLGGAFAFPPLVQDEQR